ncbi:hypothetical protein TSMEX_002050 [Taenia solium]|eukprot:TsM_000309800 transcript=TsM_000309800 gene=TsM_000309800
MCVAGALEGTENEHLGELLGTGYMCNFTSFTMNPLTIFDRVETVNRDSVVLTKSTMFRKILDMFGLMCLLDADNHKRHAELAREVWHKSLMESVKQTTALVPPVKPISLNSTSSGSMDNYYRSLLKKLRSGDLCESSKHVFWRIMRSLKMNFEDEIISFLPNGGLKVSKIFV